MLMSSEAIGISRPTFSKANVGINIKMIKKGKMKALFMLVYTFPTSKVIAMSSNPAIDPKISVSSNVNSRRKALGVEGS
mgnify:CR=1 FL=1